MTTLLVDYSMARPTPATIKTAGYSGVMRYLSTDPAKNLQPAERDDLLAAGLGIGLIWETTAARAADGFAAGVADARAAEAEAAKLNLPAGLPIFYAVDFAAAPTTVKAYFDGIRSVATRPVGIYGSLSVVDAALAGGWATYAWQSCAWSGGLVSQHAHLYQRFTPTVAHPIAGTDEDVVLRAFPLWTKAPAPAPVVAKPVVRPPASSIPVLFRKVVRAVIHATGLGSEKPWGMFPLKDGGWYGLNDGTAKSHPGAQLADQRAVKQIQREVGVLADGDFGAKTAAAVALWQRAHGLRGDGCVGVLTWNAMTRA